MLLQLFMQSSKGSKATNISFVKFGLCALFRSSFSRSNLDRHNFYPRSATKVIVQWWVFARWLAFRRL